MKKDNSYSEYNKAKSIAQSLTDKISDKECDEQILKEWINNNEYSYDLCEKFTQQENVKQALGELHNINKAKEEAVKKLLYDVKKQEKKIGRIRILKYAISSCAAAIAVISFMLYNNSNSKTEVVKENIIAQNQTPIDSNSPILILSNGKQIDLEEQNDKLIENKIIVTNNKKAIKYLDSDSNTTEELFNTLITKKTQTYSVILSDGTEVILNANSEIKYPVTFQGDYRKVELKGEAYFKVQKGTTPFIVNTKDVNIQVYGTEFNINSRYDNQVYTVLVKGSVGVGKNGYTQTKLQPNQLSIINSENGSSIVKNIDVNNYISWLNSDFIYDERNFNDIINDISAWYGVVFEYDKTIFNDVTINATFSRSVSIDKLLNSISRILNINFIKQTDNKYAIRGTI